MVATRRSNAEAAEDDVQVVVETEGEVPEEVAEAAAADAVAAIAAATEEDEEAAGDPMQVEQTTTTAVTEDAPGEFTIETTRTEVPVEGDAPSEGATLPKEAVAEAVKEAVQTAQETADATGKPAVAQTTVEIAAPENSAQKENGTPAAVPTAAAVTYRLFVGCVPHQFKEEDLKPYFEAVAPIKEVMILRDQLNGSSRGCAFAIFDQKSDAEQAIEKLDKKFTLPGSSQPIEVRFARESNKVQPAAEPNDKNQLFYARAPPSATDTDVRAVFAEFGEITELALFQNRAAGVSKGCGFVFFKEKAHAQAAIDALHDKKTMTNGFMPLTVKWADPNLNEKKRKAAEEAADPNRDNAQVFFARIPKNVLEETIRKVFETVGRVKELVLFKTHQSATSNKGCGIVTMQSHEEATRVLEQLDNTYTFEGMDVAMVLKWVDQDLQKRRRMEREGAPVGGPGGYGPPPGGHGPWQGGPPMGGGPPPFGPPSGGFGGGGFGGGGGGGGFGEEERPPPGCDRDSFKLYLAGIPRTWELPDLRRIVEKFGQIVDMNLVRDKVTKEPKGVAFMWFRSRASSEHAIRELNNKSFDDGYGGKRVIQISKAKPRRNPQMGQGPGPVGGPPSGGPGFGRSPGGPGGFQQGGYPGGGRPPAPAAYQQQPAQYYQQPPAYDPYMATPPPQQQPPSYGGYQGTYQPPQPQQQPAYSAYQQPPQQAPPQAYQQQQPSVGYQQAYNPPAAPTGAYGAQAAAAATPAYGAPTGYEAQAQQQPVYGQSQYGAAPAAAAQGGYNYSATAAAAAPQGAYATPAQPAAAAPGQYSYSAAPQGYADPSGGGYNYGPSS